MEEVEYGRMMVTVGDGGDANPLVPPLKRILGQFSHRVMVYADTAGKGKDVLRKAGIPFVEAQVIDDWKGVSTLVCGTSGKAQTLHFNAMKEAKSRRVVIVGVEDLYGTALKATPEQAPYNHLVVMDEGAAKIFRRVRQDVAYIHPLGNPSYDDIPLLIPERRGWQTQFHLKHDVVKHDKVVVYWASSVKQIDVAETLDPMLAVFAGMGNVVFVPQFHPADSEEEREKWLKYIEDNLVGSSVRVLRLGRVAPDEVDLVSLAADLVITDYSTNGARSFLMGVPTIFAVMGSSQRYLEKEKKLIRPYFPQMDEGLGTVAYDGVDFQKLLWESLDSYTSLEFLAESIHEINQRDFASLVDGKATERVTNFLLSFLR